MLVALTTAKKLDWSGWMLGFIGAFISGGAGAVGAGFSTMVVDPTHFNIQNGGLHHILEAMGITFGFSAVISLAKFLQTHPVPDALTINAPGPVTVNQAPGGNVEVKS